MRVNSSELAERRRRARRARSRARTSRSGHQPMKRYYTGLVRSGMAWLFHQITETPDGTDGHPGRLDFAPKPVHEDLDGIGTDLIGDPIQSVGKLVLADDPASTEQQSFQQCHFPCGQIQCSFAHESAARSRIEG